MPSSCKPLRLCFFGDSQLGSLRFALRDNLTAVPQGVDVEFWGATGPSFRLIDWRQDAIRAKGLALEMALKVNGNGREFLTPYDFDIFIFYSARYRVAEFFGSYLQWIDETGHFPSAAVLKASARAFADETRAHRMAGRMARAGCQVFFVPAPFYTDGVLDISAKDRFFRSIPRC